MNVPILPAARRTPPSRWPGVLLGLGLGGFIDGIVIHQILQWHHMVSHVESFPVTTVQGLEVNTLADGLFHVGTWLLVFAGSTATIASWRRGHRAPSWKFHFGLVVAGWGIFNVVEGLINHQLLQIHHVRDDLGGPWTWDVGFLIFGALLSIGGLALHRQGAGERTAS
jgi:uncharacterized membrane protein